jgi:hypothetical protein
MNPAEAVIMVVAMLLIFSLVRHRMGIPARSMRQMMGEDARGDLENERLRAQVKQLQDRINVLERIVTDRGVQTAAQIEALREREQTGEEDRI